MLDYYDSKNVRLPDWQFQDVPSLSFDRSVGTAEQVEKISSYVIQSGSQCPRSDLGALALIDFVGFLCLGTKCLAFSPQLYHLTVHLKGALNLL